MAYLLLDILLDHRGVIKYVDFGASKILAKNRTMQRSRRGSDMGNLARGGGLGVGLGMNNSLTGTPAQPAEPHWGQDRPPE